MCVRVSVCVSVCVHAFVRACAWVHACVYHVYEGCVLMKDSVLKNCLFIRSICFRGLSVLKNCEYSMYQFA